MQVYKIPKKQMALMYNSRPFSTTTLWINIYVTYSKYKIFVLVFLLSKVFVPNLGSPFIVLNT
jgi:hypothetical protein